MKKTFKIGEYAKGGTIQAEINTEDVTVRMIDWNSKEILDEQTTDDFGYLDMVLNDWTSSYYADTIIDWIRANQKETII